MSSWGDSFRQLIYPDLCICCWERNPINEKQFCVQCLTELPFTSHFEFLENTVTKKFWGRADIIYGASLFYFGKGSMIREMIHKFKYNNKPSIGVQLGRIAGGKMQKSDFFKDIDFIIPVPLYHLKLLKRGYNQSRLFAKGISEILNISVVDDLLIKHQHTVTQTGKTRLDRFENVINSFSLFRPERYEGSHFLLVDDVITTGATLEACIHRLTEVKGSKFSILTIVMARN